MKNNKIKFAIFYILSVTAVIASNLFLSCSCENDEDPLLFNKEIIGTWELENHDGEYIRFDANNSFVMNDIIFGDYNIQDAEDYVIWYYAEDEDGNVYEVYNDPAELEENPDLLPQMEFSDIRPKKSMTVKHLPLHKDETIKIIYKK